MEKISRKTFYAIHCQTYFFVGLPHNIFLLTKTNRNANKKAPLEINVQFTTALNTMEFGILNTSRKTRSSLVMMVNVSISDHCRAWNGVVITVTTTTSQWLPLVNVFTYQPLAVKYVVVVAGFVLIDWIFMLSTLHLGRPGGHNADLWYLGNKTGMSCICEIIMKLNSVTNSLT